MTKAQKKELCEKKRDNPNIKGIDLAQEYEISTQSVSDILSQSSQWLNYDASSLSTSHLYRNRTSDYPDIEEATRIWVDQLLARDLTLSGSIIQEKAREFANIFEISNFNASSGWLAKFKNRNNLHSYKKRGESMSAPIQEIADMQLQLQEILQEYSPDDIWNCDETALFWRLEPNRTIAHAPLLGRKRPKDRITAMLTCSLAGEKLPALFIHRSENPRCLRGIEKNSLPVWYYWNTKAWMQRSIFKHYLERFNSKMVRQNRNIILLLDNASSHNAENIPTLSNIKVHFLPPNTTSILQPLDQGIIYSLKVIN